MGLISYGNAMNKDIAQSETALGKKTKLIATLLLSIDDCPLLAMNAQVLFATLLATFYSMPKNAEQFSNLVVGNLVFN